MRSSAARLVAALLIAVLAGPGTALAAAFPGPGTYSHRSYGSGLLAHPYSLYVPSALPVGRRVPLLVMVHGCNTSDDEQAMANQYHAIAEREHFEVLYPDVNSTNAGRCWKAIALPLGESRGQGDAAVIAGMTREVLRAQPIDPRRVYVIGMSSGAFETSMLAADYPDLYTAIGLHSGAAYGAGPTCIATGRLDGPPGTASLARQAYGAMGSHARVVPVVVLHGDADATVPYSCGRQGLQQWIATSNLVRAAQHRPPVSSVPDVAREGRAHGGKGLPFTIRGYHDSDGCLVAQMTTVHGMDHFWSGGSGDKASAPFTDPRGPSAAVLSWRFFRPLRLSQRGPACSRRHR